MAKAKGDDKLVERLDWLIRLRWIAIIGVVLTILFVHYILNISIQFFPLYLTTGFLAIYNVLFLLYLNFLKRRPLERTSIISNIIANGQISLDLLCLTLLIHFSGGIENPFIFYFIFHMIIASTLLTRKASFLQATLAIFLFSFMVFLEYTGILPHYCLKGFIPYSLHNNPLYILGVFFVFISTLYIAVYMATSISNELRDREKSLQEANRLLNEKDRIKSEYVLRVTHDIKEHLSAVQSCIEPVANGITGFLNERQKDLLFRARDRAGKLFFFIKALLEITKIKLTKKVKMEEFSFGELIKAISEDIEARAKEKSITFNLVMNPSIGSVKGVRVYIEEAISNLLANSLKYAPKGGKISLKVYDRGNAILIQISDTGIGIPKDEMAHLFEEFFRGRNAKKIERQGTGLGLSITKEIMEMHRGRVWAESGESKGTTFYLEFPK